jgi:hypothetical protein
MDKSLTAEARRTGGRKAKTETVHLSRSESPKLRKQLTILKAFGTVDFDPTCDYKAERRRKRS